MSNIVVGDNGTVFEFTVTDDDGPVDLTTVVSVVVHFVRADRSTFDKTASVTDADTGTCTIVLTAADITVAGRYTFQATATFSDDDEFSSGQHRFTVDNKL